MNDFEKAVLTKLDTIVTLLKNFDRTIYKDPTGENSVCVNGEVAVHGTVETC